MKNKIVYTVFDGRSKQRRWLKKNGKTLLGVTVLSMFASAILTSYLLTRNTEIISPVSKPEVKIEVKQVEAIEIPPKKENLEISEIDVVVGKYIDKYFSAKSQRSEMRMIMSCLLHRESKHNGDTGRGDGGLALGILQFHQETWNGYRKLMIKDYLVAEIGSPFNDEEAIETTVWAISTKRATAWGPIARWKQGRYKEASCPMPTFY